ncbi:MAG: hypothetical protein IIC67_10445, partial [Thaumarchaeota archaeon]|nr:hypothetical protein [Nitrososphaerota archaeon]
MTNQNDNRKSKNPSPAKLVYLFTSTRQPYIKDALDLLALPLGMTYRFRYDVKYLPNEFFENQDNEKKLVSLNGKDALLVHVHTTPKNIANPNEIPKILEALPLRKAKILEAKLMGDFVWIQFILGNWIKYDNAKKSSKNIYHQKIIDILPVGSENEFKITAMIAREDEFFEINELSLSQEAVISNWSNLVSFVKDFLGHEHSVFLKLIRIIDLNCSDALSPEDLGNSKFERDFTYKKEVFDKNIIKPIYEEQCEDSKTNSSQDCTRVQIGNQTIPLFKWVDLTTELSTLNKGNITIGIFT